MKFLSDECHNQQASQTGPASPHLPGVPVLPLGGHGSDSLRTDIGSSFVGVVALKGRDSGL